jgi:hypothetical protein
LNVSITTIGNLEMEIGRFCQCHGKGSGNKIKDGEIYGQNNTI